MTGLSALPLTWWLR